MFSIGIFHGEQKRFRAIITSIPYFKTLGSTIDEIKNILTFSKDTAIKHLTVPENLAAQLVNPGGGKIDESLVLNDK